MERGGQDRGTTTHFGFREVGIEDKPGLVREVFDSVADRYDLMNDLMSGGVHRVWKATLIDQLHPRPDMHLLDVAGGTGDIALRYLARGGGKVTVCDLNRRMLEVGRDRALDRGLVSGARGGIEWVAGDAEALPLPDGAVDAYTCAFGLRNVTRLDAALAEARRVLRPGGRFLVLEFSRVSQPILKTLYDRYSFTVLPALGGAIAGDAQAYRYLAESIRKFPPQDEFAGMIATAGFARVGYRNLSFGIAAIHAAWRV